MVGEENRPDRRKQQDKLKVYIIREVYEGENSHETFELELERGLEEGSDIIVVEPSRLGDETARWISVGNCLHKTAVYSGIGSIASGLIWSERPYVCTPLGALSLLCAGLHTISWQFDPCVQYQVESDLTKFAHIPEISALTSASPVVLVHCDNSRRKLFQASVTILAAIFCAWRLYSAYK
ncbi:transmembrane protein 11 homolog, mitochondrial [Bacillus rossius redtenbacheri]|uniref:transmembrane protein 11 homolog, mitochondrial n=1 Tax=Bacillus rossius redtenbacheri TaxID=93214 RepID=UPI002FDCC3F6